jgi:hypothetical protein
MSVSVCLSVTFFLGGRQYAWTGSFLHNNGSCGPTVGPHLCATMGTKGTSLLECNAVQQWTRITLVQQWTDIVLIHSCVRVVKWPTLVQRIRKFPATNLARRPARRAYLAFSWFYSMPEKCLKLDRFLARTFNFTIHLSSFHSTQYSPSHWESVIT